MGKDALSFSKVGSKKDFIKVLVQGRARQDPTSSRLSQIKAIVREHKCILDTEVMFSHLLPPQLGTPVCLQQSWSSPVLHVPTPSSSCFNISLAPVARAGDAAASQPSTLPGQGGHIPYVPVGIFCPEYSPWHREISNPCCCCCLREFSPPKTLALVCEVATERWAHTSNPSSAFLCSATRHPKKQQLGCGRAAPHLFKVWVQNYFVQDKLL